MIRKNKLKSIKIPAFAGMTKNAGITLKQNIFPILLIFISMILCWKNNTPNTFLSGWDTLHPEFNFSLAFERMLNGVWRSDQGLGAVAIQSHMADLPRVIFLWLESLILPLQFLRYSYFFLMLILGPLGIYFLSIKIFSKRISVLSRLAAFSAGLTYLCNLGTLQHFTVPLEMFACLYGLLPWIFLAVINILEKATGRRYLALILLSVFAAPQAHTATLFYAYFLGLIVFLICFTLINKNKQTLVKKSLIIILIVFCTNAFWILPNIYAVINHAQEVHTSKVNRIFSPEAIAKNQIYGNLIDVPLLKNFLFNWELFDFQKQEFGPVMLQWQNHLQKPLTIGIGYAVFIIGLLGIFFAIRKNNKYFKSMIPVAIISFLFLLNGTWPISIIFENIGQLSPVIKESLRFPFTKFSILLMFSLSLFAGFGLFTLLNHVKQNKWKYITIVVFNIGLIYYFLPAFSGYLIHPAMRIQIPQEYSKMFDWFNKQNENSRIAILPINSFWNWVYYDWGYQGAGFMQFGIKQPLLDRDYNRWNQFNEQYMREMTESIYSRDDKLLEKLAQKYQITYFLIDKSIITPGSKNNVYYYDGIKSALERSADFELATNFGSNISVYKYKPNFSNPYIYTPLTYQNITSDMTAGFHDQAFMELGTYISNSNNGINYLFRNLLTKNEQIDSEKIEFDNDRILINLSNNQINPADIQMGKNLYPEFMSNLYNTGLASQSSIIVKNEETFASIPNNEIKINLIHQLQQNTNCDLKPGTKISRRIDDTDFVSYQTLTGSACDFVQFPSVSHDTGNLVTIEAQNINGIPLRICVSNYISKRCDIDTMLDFNPNWKKYIYLLPPLPDGNTGYDVHLTTNSYGNSMSQNNVRSVSMIPIPYYWLESLSNNKTDALTNNIDIINITKFSPVEMTVQVSQTSSENKGLIVLNQSFENGWVAYKINNPIIQSSNNPIIQLKVVIINWLNSSFPFLFGTKLDHKLVNNWSNGWLLSQRQGTSESVSSENNILNPSPYTLYPNTTIYIAFWPQLLEFLGFGLMIVPFVFVLSKLKK